MENKLYRVTFSKVIRADDPVTALRTFDTMAKDIMNHRKSVFIKDFEPKKAPPSNNKKKKFFKKQKQVPNDKKETGGNSKVQSV